MGKGAAGVTSSLHAEHIRSHTTGSDATTSRRYLTFGANQLGLSQGQPAASLNLNHPEFLPWKGLKVSLTLLFMDCTGPRHLKAIFLGICESSCIVRELSGLDITETGANPTLKALHLPPYCQLVVLNPLPSDLSYTLFTFPLPCNLLYL